MPQRLGWFGLVMTAALLAGTPASSAETEAVTSFHVDSGSTVTIRGTSTVSTWSCHSREIDGVLHLHAPLERVRSWLTRMQEALEDDADPALTPPPVRSRPQARLAVPVRSFECGNDRMNRDMYRALKADTYSRILFGYYSLNRVERIREGTPDVALRIGLVGGLALAGQGRTVEFTADIQRIDDLTYRVRAEKRTRMSRFGIAPPTALLGIIQARDSITLFFDMIIERGVPSDSVPRADDKTSLSPPGDV